MIDYDFKTTFWSDFSIADKFGKRAILDTYNRAFEEWKSDYIYLTELVLVLNWKIWQHYEEGRHEIAQIYNTLWEKTQSYAYRTLKGEELDYCIRTLD